MERSEVEKKILYKANDIVVDVHMNVYRILHVGIDALNFSYSGNFVKENEEIHNTQYIAYADLEVIKYTPLTQFGTLKRMLASDLWNTTHFQKLDLEAALNKHNSIRILYGDK
jgi:phosphotransferase system IIA component